MRFARAGFLSASVVLVLLLTLLASFTTASAEDVTKKWRISLSGGFFDTADSVGSDAANVLTVVDPQDIPVLQIRDPRDDSSVFGELQIESAPRLTFAAQYALTRKFIIEMSVGYQRGDVGDVELQVQFPNVEIPLEEDFNFTTFRIPVGEMEQIPIQLTGLARFRPRSSLNPYIGAGIGYIVVGFEPSSEFNELSVNMDRSVGGQAVLSSIGGISTINAANTVGDLAGATVDAGDTFEWHLVGGAEFSFKKKWAAFLDIRYVFASRRFDVSFNGEQGMGIAVPNAVLRESATTDLQIFGPVQVTQGGIVDGGQLVPDGSNPGVNCSATPTPSGCVWSFTPDGKLDRGFYYVQGGDIKYGGWLFTAGVRYTF